MNINQLREKFIDILSQNTFKGNTYYIKFKNDPTFYSGIPMLRSSWNADTENVCTVNIFEPEEKCGISQRLVSEIEFLELK